MRLTGLEPLYRSMRAQGIGRAKFRYTLNHLVFECLFFADTSPFELVMGCLGHNFAIFLDVRNGFQITPRIEPQASFFALHKALFQNAGSNHRFNPVTFFNEFDQHIPAHVTPQQAATAHDVVRYYPDIEEADRLHFCGWLDNSQQGHRVSEKNLDKTGRLQGQLARDFSQRRNQSTRWTDDPTKAKAFFIPT